MFANTHFKLSRQSTKHLYCDVTVGRGRDTRRRDFEPDDCEERRGVPTVPADGPRQKEEGKPESEQKTEVDGGGNYFCYWMLTKGGKSLFTNGSMYCCHCVI